MRAVEIPEVIALVAREAEAFLSTIDDALVRPASIPMSGPIPPLPATGVDSVAALQELIAAAVEGATRSTGPRFFHFVMGGVTPAALGGDWLASTLNQSGYNWVSSPFASRLEHVTIGWLKELFGLPESWSGVITTGATMANFVGLASARRWWALQHGVDIDAGGFSGLPPVPVFGSGYLHASAVKALGMLGIGRATPQILARSTGRFDVEGLRRGLEVLAGAPAIVVATAGDVNTGDFDPIAEIVDACAGHSTWIHVDGAFGMFAALSDRTRALVTGVGNVQSVAVDGHKWLNVPYDTGFGFVRDGVAQSGVFGASAAYLGAETLARPVFGNLGPEMSRRARALAAWASLRAYGREGYRQLVERHLELAQRVAAQVDAAPDLERLADVPLNVVCFRFHPPGVAEQDLDDLNRRLGQKVLEDGRVYFGTTEYMGKVAFRPAMVNWRTREEDVDLIVSVTRELGSRLTSQAMSA